MLVIVTNLNIICLKNTLFVTIASLALMFSACKKEPGPTFVRLHNTLDTDIEQAKLVSHEQSATEVGSIAANSYSAYIAFDRFDVYSYHVPSGRIGDDFYIPVERLEFRSDSLTVSATGDWSDVGECATGLEKYSLKPGQYSVKVFRDSSLGKHAYLLRFE